MDPAQVSAFNARAAAQRVAFYLATLVFGGATKQWTVAFGPIRNSRQLPDHGQGFVYFKEAIVHFPVDSTFTPKLGDTFTRQPDTAFPKPSNWRIETISTPPLESYHKLTVARVD